MNNKFQNARLYYDGTTLSKNLLKHANAPTIVSAKHPNPKYPYKRIIIKPKDAELASLMQKYDSKDPSNAITLISPSMLTCQCPRRTKFVKILDTDVHDPDEAMVWTACRHTTFAAAKRQMKAAPTPDPVVADDFIEHSIEIVENEIGDYLTDFKYSVKDWIHHLNAQKQKALQPVMDYYEGKAYNLSKKKLNEIQNKHYTGILKEELQEIDGKPRMVCSIPQSTKYIMGPVTWQLEEIFQDHLQGYCGGANLDQMAKEINEYLAQGFIKVVEGDGSSFDNTQDVSLKAIDRYIYSRIADKVYHVPVSDFREVSQALYKTMDINYIDSRSKKKKELLSYTILGTVFSGDCDTTLMNTTRMALYNRYVNDKAGLVFGKDYVCFAKGDDFTLMYKPYVTDDFITNAYYKYFLPANPDTTKPDTRVFGLGQVLKKLDFGDASTLNFCSLRSFFTDPSENKIYLTRDPKKFFNLAKYSRKAKDKNVNYLYDYLIAQAIALEVNYPQITIFRQMASLYRNEADYLYSLYGPVIHKNKYTNELLVKIVNSQNSVSVLDESIFDSLESDNWDLVAHRHNQIKIQKDYWSTMKLLEKSHVETLTQQEADYINLQMNSTFMVEYIKSMLHLGPNK